MPMTKLTSALTHNVDVGIGAVLGGITSLGFASAAPAGDGGSVSWVQVLTSLCVALTPILVKQMMAWRKGEAAGDRVRAAKKRGKADLLRKAGKVAEADKLDEEADELEAQAAEHEAKARGGVE